MMLSCCVPIRPVIRSVVIRSLRRSATHPISTISSSSSSSSTVIATPHQHQQKQQERHNNGSSSMISRRYMGSYPKFRPKRLRVITMDVTGTIVSFKGSLQTHYVETARQCGVAADIDPSRIDGAFKQAYEEMCALYPCFGSDNITGKEWWKLCVLKSFEYSGCRIASPVVQDQVFQRIYSRFGSQLAYGAFDDAIPFLSWAHRNGLVCGVLSNADERYGDSILPMLGLTHDYLQFQCFSKYHRVEKPDGRFFKIAMRQAESWIVAQQQQQQQHGETTTTTTKTPLSPSEVLHIGNDFRKDFEGARRAGMHCVLLERYGNDELAGEWRRRGVPVCTDLLDVVEFLGRSGCSLG